MLEVRGLVARHRGGVRAVDGVGFDVREGETLALVGESGCGKTSTLMEILELRAPGVAVLGRPVAGLSRSGRRAVRRDVQVVFQDSLAALDPRMPVAELVAEPLRAHREPEAAARVLEAVALVGLEEGLLGRYPAELSGGQRQRVQIARALVLRPKVVLLDEPVSALDVSVRAGVLALLADLRRRLGLAYLVVAHDLAVVRLFADRVAVMYLGRIVELGHAEQVCTTPVHPYTRALLAAVPVPDPRAPRPRAVLRGDPPSAARPAGGCGFRARCPVYEGLDAERRQWCEGAEPQPRELPDGRQVACHHAEGALR